MRANSIKEYITRYDSILKFINEAELGGAPDPMQNQPPQPGGAMGQPTSPVGDTGMSGDTAGQMGGDMSQDPMAGGMGGDMGQPNSEPMPTEQPQTEPMDMGGKNDVNAFQKETEIDVTDLVKGQEEMKKGVGEFNNKLEYLLQKLSDLEGKIKNMDSIANKIDSVKKDIEDIKPPTPKERLEMISLDSAPFSQTVDDYWKDKKTNLEKYREKKRGGYEVSQQDVNDYNEVEIKNSFDAPSEDDYDGKSNPFKRLF